MGQRQRVLAPTTHSSADRAVHMAVMMNAANQRQAYATLHADMFTEANLQKFRLINAEGVEIGAANEATELLTNANGTVRHEDFIVIQDKIVEVRRRSLNGITDLQGAGLSFNVNLSEQLVGFENVNEFQAAQQAMNPNGTQNNDTVFTETFVPNPITFSGFEVPWRQGQFDYKRSLGMSESVRQVAERLEETLFNGNTAIVVDFNGSLNPLYGYTTHPDRGTGTISDWTSGANIGNIIPETVAEIGAMWSGQGGVENDSVIMYVANDIWTVFQNDYKAEVSGTIFERVAKIAQIKEVRPAEKLANGEVVLVEMMARTVELAVASDIITVPHVKTNPLAPTALTTYAAMVHQIKVDSNQQTGVRHLTTA